MEPSDARLRESIRLAKESGIALTYQPTDLGDVHPNTVKFIMTTADNHVTTVQGASIGGGNIEINAINEDACSFTGAYPTLLISHHDMPGMIAKVTTVLYNASINIAFMRVFRQQKGKNASMIFETDSFITEEVLCDIRKIDEIESAIAINPVEESIE